MPPEVLQRLTWNGTPKELVDLFALHKGSNHRTARCQADDARARLGMPAADRQGACAVEGL